MEFECATGFQASLLKASEWVGGSGERVSVATTWDITFVLGLSLTEHAAVSKQFRRSRTLGGINYLLRCTRGER